MKTIKSRIELIALAKELGVRPDWHEPDEQNVTAIPVTGYSFDNAFLTPRCGDGDLVPHEHFVMVYKDSQPVAAVNLAILFAWATGYNETEWRLNHGGAKDDQKGSTRPTAGELSTPAQTG